jgi:hypothetical protein
MLRELKTVEVLKRKEGGIVMYRGRKREVGRRKEYMSW